MSCGNYDAKTFRQLTFHDRVSAFVDGTDTPRNYLERCIGVIDEREHVVRGWAALRLDEARAEADASTKRYREGRPLSAVDGMPYGAKDLIETRDLPTRYGIQGHPGHFGEDSPSVWALREAGAVMVGKTVTTELGGGSPVETTNPFDPDRTPGGSSSGSGAVVAAGMVPMALGSQVGGSLTRPASYCGNVALRPTLGGINRGERLAASHGIIGPHAGCLTDMWRSTIEIAERVGGDPGYPGVFGTRDPLPPRKPERLVLLETAGWARCSEATIRAFDGVVDQLRSDGVEIVRRTDNAQVESLESILVEAEDIARTVLAWENRWSLESLSERYDLQPMTLRMLAHGRAISLDEYRAALVRREEARGRLSAVAALGEALVTLSSPGPAPMKHPPADHDPAVPFASTGSPIFNFPASILGAPAINLPVMAVDGMPVGLQLVGQQHRDHGLTGTAGWILQEVDPVSVSS